MGKLAWTNDIPTVEGLFWHKEHGKDATLETVVMSSRGMAVRNEDSDGYPWHMELSYFGGKWAGPVLPPADDDTGVA